MARNTRLAIAAAIVCLLSPPSLQAWRSSQAGLAGPGWATGPVWYIMTSSEYRDYRRLRSDSDRREFIRGFWNQRDPLPDTTENELEREFWGRVQVADRRFGQDIKPGWKTERGKVFILLGPPDNVEADHILADAWGASRWSYDLGAIPLQLRLVLRDSLGVPADRRFVNIRVRRESEGLRSSGGAMAHGSTVLRPTDFLPLAEMLVRRVPGPDALRNLGHAMRVPEVMDRLRSDVQVSTVFSMVPVQARVDFRPGTASRANGLTSVAVTLGVRWADLHAVGVTTLSLDDVLMTGVLTALEDGRSHDLAGRFAADATSGGRIADSPDSTLAFQAVLDAPPGRYLLDVAYQDPEERIMGAVRDLIDVPAFADQGLTVGSLILAARVESWAEPPSGPERAFGLGPYRVVPRTSAAFTQPTELRVAYQVHGAALDSAGAGSLEVAYQFYLEDDGGWLPVGPPISAGQTAETTQTWGVPLRGWAPGRYRLELSATDLRTGAMVTRGTLFEILASPAP